MKAFVKIWFWTLLGSKMLVCIPAEEAWEMGTGGSVGLIGQASQCNPIGNLQACERVLHGGWLTHTHTHTHLGDLKKKKPRLFPVKGSKLIFWNYSALLVSLHEMSYHFLFLYYGCC